MNCSSFNQSAMVQHSVVGLRRQHLVVRSRKATQGALKDLAAVLAFSAIPFLATQGLADSDFGKKLYQNVQDNIPKFEQQKAKLESERAQVRDQSPFYGNSRPLWLLPQLASDFAPPPYLDGSMPGDYGFDVLGLGRNEEKLEKYVELELLHARWAMLGIFGAVIPESLQLSGVTTFPEPVWWKVAGSKLASGQDLNYLGVAGLRIAGGQGVLVIAVCQVLLMFGPEYARACGIRALDPLGLYLPGDLNYPGSWLFDPFGLSNDPKFYERARVAEIKHGRLAMVSFLGFATQALVTRGGPIQNLVDFWRNPGSENVFKYIG